MYEKPSFSPNPPSVVPHEKASEIAKRVADNFVKTVLNGRSALDINNIMQLEAYVAQGVSEDTLILAAQGLTTDQWRIDRNLQKTFKGAYGSINTIEEQAQRARKENAKQQYIEGSAARHAAMLQREAKEKSKQRAALKGKTPEQIVDKYNVSPAIRETLLRSYRLICRNEDTAQEWEEAKRKQAAANEELVKQNKFPNAPLEWSPPKEPIAEPVAAKPALDFNISPAPIKEDKPAPIAEPEPVIIKEDEPVPVAEPAPPIIEQNKPKPAASRVKDIEYDFLSNQRPMSPRPKDQGGMPATQDLPPIEDLF